jgi:hypothetical protein
MKMKNWLGMTLKRLESLQFVSQKDMKFVKITTKDLQLRL